MLQDISVLTGLRIPKLSVEWDDQPTSGVCHSESVSYRQQRDEKRKSQCFSNIGLQKAPGNAGISSTASRIGAYYSFRARVSNTGVISAVQLRLLLLASSAAGGDAVVHQYQHQYGGSVLCCKSTE